MTGVQTCALPISTAGGELSVGGWVIDPDVGDPVDVHIYMDGRLVGQTTADQGRPDVEAAFPGFGSDHGFSASLNDVAAGSHTVCAYGISRGPGGNILLGCRVTEVLINPFGNVDSAKATTTDLKMDGWAMDVYTAGPIDVHIYIDGQLRKAITADRSRPDVGSAYPGFGANHGFSTDIDNVVSGSHLVCAYGINTGPGGNALLGCRTVIINLPVNPFGSLDGVSLEDQGPGVQSGNLTVNGWAIDPDTVDPIDVHVYLDGQLEKAVTADLEIGRASCRERV